MSHRTSGRHVARTCLAGLLIATIAVAASACEEAFDGPTILSLTIEPSAISTNNAGMADEFFDVTIEVTGFESEIDAEAAEVFIVENDRPYVERQMEPNRTDVVVEGTTVRVINIPTKWFEHMETGTYNIGATVADVNGSSDTQLNLDQVEVTE